ncbi:MAG TPA: YbjN domain-containing protein [Rhodobacteraceae bacterium]|nr:YbjN domain-containing protein [Paracoccaceae bacterium]
MIHAKSFPAALLAALLLTAPAPGTAQTLIDATQIETIAAIASDYGEAIVEQDSAGDPMISGQIARTNYAVLFFGCTDGADCTRILFLSSYSNTTGVDMETLNAWNRDGSFGKAYLDADGDPAIEMNVNLWSGVHQNNLNDTFDWWRVVLETFEEHIGFEHADETVAPAADAPAVREAETDAPAASTGNPTALGMGSSSVQGGSKVKINR